MPVAALRTHAATESQVRIAVFPSPGEPPPLFLHRLPARGVPLQLERCEGDESTSLVLCDKGGSEAKGTMRFAPAELLEILDF